MGDVMGDGVVMGDGRWRCDGDGDGPIICKLMNAVYCNFNVQRSGHSPHHQAVRVRAKHN